MVHLYRLALALALLLPQLAQAVVCTQYVIDTSLAFGQTWQTTRVAAFHNYCAARAWQNCYPINPSTGLSISGFEQWTQQFNIGYNNGSGNNSFPGQIVASRTGDHCTSACPTELSNIEASLTSVKENLSETTAKDITRATALAGGVQECSVDGCIIVRKTAACGGISGVWRCELYGGSANASTCTAAAGNAGLLNIAVTPAPSTTATSTATGTPAGAGMCSGTFNGATVYYKCVDSITVGTTTSSVTSGTATSTTNSETTTTCGSTTCTSTISGTTTSAVTGGGTTTTTGTVVTIVPKPSASFCTENPTATGCVPSKFSGTCTASFACDGDAAICATAKATNEQNCLLQKDSPEKMLYESTLAAGTSTTGLGTETIGISSANFSQENLLGAAACFADRTVTITVAGYAKTVTLAFSVICPYAANLGLILVAVAMLAAMAIVFRKSS